MRTRSGASAHPRNGEVSEYLAGGGQGDQEKEIRVEQYVARKIPIRQEVKAVRVTP